MPWKETTPMTQKERFVTLAQTGRFTGQKGVRVKKGSCRYVYNFQLSVAFPINALTAQWQFTSNGSNQPPQPAHYAAKPPGYYRFSRALRPNCIMSNHFHVLARVPDPEDLSDAELMRRYKVLYPEPTKYQTASTKVMEEQLQENGEEAEKIRCKLLARMSDVSQFMKTVKQRFSVWYNRNHRRYGTLWADRFKSVLVEGAGNPLQTMAAYIDLNSVRAGIV